MTLFVSDCEGPLSLDDFAYECAKEFIPDGGPFFKKLSLYDDYLADIAKKDGYNAGDTLRLILPFLKVYGSNRRGNANKRMEKLARDNLHLVPDVKDTLSKINNSLSGNSFIISTSYSQYIDAFCKETTFPRRRAFCTDLDIDKYTLYTQEEVEIDQLRQKIEKLDMIELPSDIREVELEDLSESTQKTITDLDNIFWDKMPGLHLNKMIEEVKPRGGHEKAEALKEIQDITGEGLLNTIYFGDSITDTKIFEMVSNAGGLAVSFNGNSHAIYHADYAVIADHSWPIYLLTTLFKSGGIECVEDFVSNLHLNADIYPVHNTGDDYLDPTTFPVFERISDEGIEELIELSSAHRKEFRGRMIGELG
jgi:predicted HAD superfamily phosphohydrolase